MFSLPFILLFYFIVNLVDYLSERKVALEIFMFIHSLALESSTKKTNDNSNRF